MKKRVFIFFVILMLLITGISFAESQYPNVNSEEFQRLLSEVKAGKRSPDVLTNRVIIKEYQDDGSYIYKSVTKQEYNNLIYSGNRKGKRIEYVQPDYIRYAYGDSISWGGERIGAGNFKDEIGVGSEVIVAVLDTGVDSHHPFLHGRVIKGYNFVDRNTNTEDINGHGTHCAGIITDVSTENVKIMPVKVLDDEGYGNDYNIAMGIRYAVDNGADIISMSLGGPGHSYFMQEAIEYAIDNNVLVVVAAGNDSSNTEDYYPAGEELAIVVSATDPDDQLADFSNFGSTVDISAPGVDILSSVPWGYEYYSGTSMATPFISGIAAMFKSEDPSRNIYELEALLKTYTDDLGPMGRDDLFGEGIINVSNYKKYKRNFELISPADYTYHSDYITLKYYANDLIGAELEVFADGKSVLKRIIYDDGYFEDIIDISDVTSQSIILEIQVTKDDELVYFEGLYLYIIPYNTIIKAYNINNEIQENYTALVYYVGDIGDRGLGYMKKVNVVDGTLKLNIDYDEILEVYNHIVVLLYKKGDLSFPIYVKELYEGGTYEIKPENLNKVTVSTDFGDLTGFDLNLIPRFKGFRFSPIIRINSLDFSKSNSVDFYISKGNHIIILGGSKYSATKVLDNSSSTVISLNKNTTGTLNFVADENLSGNFAENYRAVFIFHGDSLISNQTGFSLIKGNNYHILPYGTYYILTAHNPNGIEYYTYRKVVVDKNNKNTTLRYDSNNVFDDYYELNVYDNGYLNGKLEMKDQYGNIYLTENRFPFDYGFMGAVYKYVVDEDLDDEDISFENGYSTDYLWETDIRIYLRNKSTGKLYSTYLNTLLEFEFNKSIPDGEYELYTTYQNGEYIFNHKVLDVVVEDNKFVVEKDYSEYELINEIKNVELDKIWTVEFNRNYNDEEIKCIKIMKSGKEVNCIVNTYDDEPVAIVEPVGNYEPNAKYIILVELTNGNKYRLEFTTKSK